MNLLYVVPNVPSLVRIRPYSFIQELVKRGHTVDCVCLLLGEDGESIKELSRLCQNVSVVMLRRWRAVGRCAGALVGQAPLRAAYFSEAELFGQVRRRLAVSKYDLVHFEHIKSYRALRRTRQMTSVPVVVDMVDCVSLFLREQLKQRHGLTRAILLQELARTESLEMECLGTAACFVTGPNDRAALLGLAPSANVVAIPNGVRLGERREARPVASVVFWGKLDYAPNADALKWICRNLAPAVREAFPNLRIRVAGANCTSTQAREAKLAGVELTGYFSSVDALVETSEIAIAPVRFGAGLQNKVLEAMAHGIPLVATGFAVRGLGASHGREYLQAESVSSFVEAIRDLIIDRGRRVSLVEEAYKFVRDRHSWGASTDKLEGLYEIAISGSQTTMNTRAARSAS